jgi:hypothetical protein
MDAPRKIYRSLKVDTDFDKKSLVKVIAEIKASYVNAHVLMYDTAFEQDEEGTNLRPGEHVKIFFTEKTGVMIDYATKDGPTTINVRPDNSIEIKNPNGDYIVMKNNGNITFNHYERKNII